MTETESDNIEIDLKPYPTSFPIQCTQLLPKIFASKEALGESIPNFKTPPHGCSLLQVSALFFCVPIAVASMRGKWAVAVLVSILLWTTAVSHSETKILVYSRTIDYLDRVLILCVSSVNVYLLLTSEASPWLLLTSAIVAAATLCLSFVRRQISVQKWRRFIHAAMHATGATSSALLYYV